MGRTEMLCIGMKIEILILAACIIRRGTDYRQGDNSSHHNWTHRVAIN